MVVGLLPDLLNTSPMHGRCKPVGCCHSLATLQHHQYSSAFPLADQFRSDVSKTFPGELVHKICTLQIKNCLKKVQECSYTDS
jgi:hypothetical protein